MEYVVFFALMIVFIIVMSIVGVINQHRAAKELGNKLKRNYGKKPLKKFIESKFEYIPKYHLKHKSPNSIDDITWNDLSMDDVYVRMDYCQSAAGEEYLYHMLRDPLQMDDFDELEESITYYDEHEDTRCKCQSLLSLAASRNKYSIYDYLDFLDNLGKRSNAANYLFDALIVISIIGCFFYFSFFFILLLMLIVYNIITYFKQNGEVNPYMSSFSYVLRLLKCVDKLHKIKDEHLQKELGKITEDEAKLKPFRSGAGILASAGNLGANGSILDIFISYFCIVTHLDMIKFNQMLSEIRKNMTSVDNINTCIGLIDSEIAIGCYRKSLDSKYCIPEFIKAKEIHTQGLYHPGINNPVPCSFDLEGNALITGSNASGKSTFLKTVAINTILAQTIHTSLAERYEAPLYRVYSSMALRDDLVGGESYYIVEIKSLKRIIDAAKEDGNPVLCMIDEVLRGTNTIERIAASSQILKNLCSLNATSFAATHDIELTELLKTGYKNYHFEGDVHDDNVEFGYELKDGPAVKRNAIKLLGILGYDDDIVKASQKMADDFSASGIWQIN